MGASPIYQPQNSLNRGNYLGTNIGQSPQYSPNSLQSPRYPGGQKPYSPIYNQQIGSAASGLGSTGKSPGYSPTSNLRGILGAPAGQGTGPIQQSPAYSPTSLSK